MSDVRVRDEAPRDVEAVRSVLTEAFPSAAEANLVDALRGQTDPQISLVAEHPTRGIVGHILFTPVTIRSAASKAIGLGPMAVHPAIQRRGVGSALVAAGLAACEAAGEQIVVVLGHPSYYPRFGFQPAWDFGLYYVAEGPNPAFMARELRPGALTAQGGEVSYHPAFDEL